MAPSDILLVLIIILVAVIVIRGPKTLPKWGAALGKGVKDAKSEAAKAQAEIQARTTSPEAPSDPAGPGAGTQPPV
jgi:Sec-independent protein translocase protein TatA